MSDALVLNDFVLVDGKHTSPRTAARVTIEGGVVVSVGDASTRLAGATVVEGRGRWLLPGFWDTHVHHVLSAGGMVWDEEFSEEQRLSTWRAYLRSGVTSIVSVGDDKGIILRARAAERQGTLLAPRIFASGPVLTAVGGHPVATILHGQLSQFGELAVELDDPLAARHHVRELVEIDRVDLVKVVYSTIPGGVPRLRRDVLEAVVDAAHALGRRVVAHVATVDDASDCLEANVDGLEHMLLAEADAVDAVFASASERGVVWTPTLSLFDKMAHDGDQGYIDAYRPEGFVSRTVLASLEDPRAWWRKPDPGAPGPPWVRTVELAGRAHAAGVRLALGTDAGNPAVFHGLAVHRELELLVRAGLSPLNAVRAATAVAAEKVGADSWLGTVEPGKEADLIVLRASPLEDIRNTRRIDMVIKKGQRLDLEALRV